MDDLQGELRWLSATLAQADAPKTRVIDELATMRRELTIGRPPRFELANVRVASPCKERWADMTGDERVRVCNGCERPVFNLSEMTRAEAEAVLATRGITPCVRFYRRTDGTLITKDCPTGARRSKRLAVVAAGTALLAPSVARAEADDDEPDAVSSADGAELTAQSTQFESELVTMGEMLPPPQPQHTTFEWSTWVRGDIGMASQASEVAARSTMPLLPERSTTAVGTLGADLSLSVANRGNIRVGAWGELRTSSGPPVLGGELIVGGLPPHPYSSHFDGGGNVVLRIGANEHVLTTALGFGYSGAWDREDPWIESLQHAGGVRMVASMNRSLDDPRDWSVTLGLEVDPITLATGLVHLISDD